MSQETGKNRLRARLKTLLSAETGAEVAGARTLGIRLWIMMRDQIITKSSAVAERRGRKAVVSRAGMPATKSGPAQQ